MKIMFKIKQIGACAGMAALMMAGAWLNAACSSDEAIVENKPVIGENTTPTETTVKFTATLAPKGDNGSGTRAITPGTDSESKEILNVVWKKDEEIAVRYESTSTFGNISVIAKVTHVDETTGVATIEAPLYYPKDGGSVTFVYPASLVNSTGDDIDADKLLNQHGNLMARTTPNASVDDISTYFDAATGSGTLDVNAGKAVVSSKVTMYNRVCICKFKFTLDNGTGSGPSIGGGQQRQFNKLKIYDGNSHVYTITSDRPDDYTSGTRGFMENEDIYVAMLPVSSKTVIFHYEQTVTGGKANYIKYAPNTTLAAGKFYRSLNLTLTKDDYNGVHNFKEFSENAINAADGDIIYQSNSTATSHTITITNGATVTLAGVNISAAGSAGIICNGNVTINLVGTNSVKSTADKYPAIQAGGNGTTLTIQGSGSLTAIGGDWSTGIGSGYHGTCGNITISSGTVTAIGGDWGTGIGSGYYGTCGNITISSGTVTATGGTGSAGIGSGSGVNCTCGNIKITGGTISANGGSQAAGIGSGYDGTCGDITISSGTVTATGGTHAAGIGSGYEGKYTSITISSGIAMVKATKGNKIAEAPIGKGAKDKNSGSVTIDGTTSWTAGTATEHLNFTISTTTWTNDTWTLTHK